MKQILLNRLSLNNAGTRYYHPAIAVKADADTSAGEQTGQTVEESAVLIAPCAGTITNLYITLDAAPTTGKSWTFTVRKNGSDTGITFSIADDATTGSSANTVSVVAGDLISISQVSSGTPSNTVAKSSLEFQGTVTGYFGIYGGVRHTTATSLNPIGMYQTEAFDNSTSGRNQSILKLPINFTVREVHVKLSVDPGDTDAKEVILCKVDSATVTELTPACEVAAGSTQNSTTGLSEAITPAVSTHGLVVRVTITGTPAASTIMYTFVCEAENDNSSMIFTTNGTRTNTDGFKPLIGTAQTTGSGVSTDDVIVGPQGFTLKNLYVRNENTISALDNRVFTIQKNGSNTLLSCDLSGAQFAEDTVNEVVFAEGDDINLEVDHTNANSGTGSHEYAVLEMFVPSDTPKGMTTLFGM